MIEYWLSQNIFTGEFILTAVVAGIPIAAITIPLSKAVINFLTKGKGISKYNHLGKD